MEDKYLPIGTICTLKGKNKKIMIIGFFSIEYNGNAIIYDYCGCDYPEGLLVNKKYSFNHNDIENIVYNGYKSEEQSNFNKNLLRQNSDENKERSDLKKMDVLRNFKFDENGVVIFDDVIVSKPKETLKEKEFSFDTDVSKGNFINFDDSSPSTDVQNSDNSKNWNIFKNIKFDENGVVIEAEEFGIEEDN